MQIRITGYQDSYNSSVERGYISVEGVIDYSVGVVLGPFEDQEELIEQWIDNRIDSGYSEHLIEIDTFLTIIKSFYNEDEN